MPPPSNFGLAGIAAVALALAIVWVLFVPGADWLAHHDVGSAKGPLLQTARDAARGRLLTLAAGLLAAGALIFTYLNFNLLRRNSEKTDQWQRHTHDLTEQGQVTDRYTKAVEQLGSDKLSVRIGGIYALERVARDSAIDHPTVMEVLTAFIREGPKEPSDPGDVLEIPADVQAAVTVVARRDAKRDKPQIDLTGANLRNAQLASATLAGADLAYATLAAANLIGANLAGAILAGTDLRNAQLEGATLASANLFHADLRQADLTGADLTSATLTHADLRSTGATLPSANLRGADLTSARWPEDTPVPEGWKLNTRAPSGRRREEPILAPDQ
jgi:hypothetical protein